ncbi:hypothetical protein PF008_g7919 [Phytophthora fragariae]|uniref:Uncharacterized protein n=1 Tax=Phytophthora fragariae TaxID=53985 RepID=A0A6G0S1C2_9STRA|nr:hypothetical protein PF008_g7919 [Phytophthora fragariae]
MMSPEAFGRTHKRHVTDIVRVALERKGVIGFIDVHDGMTLLEARTLIWDNVEDAPAEFQFVLDDGAPVSARQEGTQKVAYFYPMVRIRELRRGPAPSPLSSPRRPGMTATATNMTPSPSSSEKVYVLNGSGVKEFYMSIPEELKEQERRVVEPVGITSERIPATLLEKPDWKEAITPLEISAIDTRPATLPNADRPGSPPRSPSLLLRTSSAAPQPPSPLGKVPLRQEDEKFFFESILLKGGVFKKYGQWGNPHRRFVWCSKDFDAIYWRPLNKKSTLTKDGITVTSMISVLPGNSVRTRYAFMKHLSDDKALSRCFSVVAEDRRLDLEADSEATRELWTSALVFLMREHRSRSVRQT